MTKLISNQNPIKYLSLIDERALEWADIVRQDAFQLVRQNFRQLMNTTPLVWWGCVHKLSKVLANKLKSILPYNISPFQGPFVNKRQILDGILVANEFSHSRKSLAKRETFFKIDL
eukprot:TRINITY_DN39585_c1_g1_i1.p1 TRINITY_DN39585_c1_g1~~TRINITY_DN39585_c1_g1_i1.p1  ORF type:complete len:116 (+),score=13.57 TRINITY_DN39585_c1_g1_i1:621-968(+)